MSVSAPTVIKHTPESAWLDGPRVPVFTIEHDDLDPETGEPILIPDPEWTPPTEGDFPEGYDHEADRPLIVKKTAVVYTMPEKSNAGLALKLLRMMRTENYAVAMAWIFELAIGEEAYEALSNETDLDDDTLATLMERVQTRALGGLDAPKGK